jgi:hypothetical protein
MNDATALLIVGLSIGFVIGTYLEEWQTAREAQ